MAYATVADLIDLGISAKALESGPALPAIQKALAAASATVDSYIGRRFGLPLTVWGPDLRECCARLAAHNLVSTRGYSAQATDADTVRAWRDDAIKWLRDISEGRAVPAGVTASTPSGEQDSLVNMEFVRATVQGSLGGPGAMAGCDDFVSPGDSSVPYKRGW